MIISGVIQTRLANDPRNDPRDPGGKALPLHWMAVGLIFVTSVLEWFECLRGNPIENRRSEKMRTVMREWYRRCSHTERNGLEGTYFERREEERMDLPVLERRRGELTSL